MDDDNTINDEWSVFRIKLNNAARGAAGHAHDFHEWFYCEKGEGIQEIDGTAGFAMRQGDLFFLPAGQVHRAWGDAKGCQGIVIYQPVSAFHGQDSGSVSVQSLFKVLINESTMGRCRITLSMSRRAKVAEILQRMLDEERRLQRGHAIARYIAMLQILLVILREARIPVNGEFTAGRPVEVRIRNVKRFIDTHFRQPISVAQVVEMTGLSRSHFHALFRKYTGKTFVRYLNERRVNCAASLLSRQQLTPSEAGARAGFTSTSHMYCVFRKITGKPPGRYRQEALLN